MLKLYALYHILFYYGFFFNENGKKECKQQSHKPEKEKHLDNKENDSFHVFR